MKVTNACFESTPLVSLGRSHRSGVAPSGWWQWGLQGASPPERQARGGRGHGDPLRLGDGLPHVGLPPAGSGVQVLSSEGPSMGSGSLRPASQRSLPLSWGHDSNTLRLRACLETPVTSLVETSSPARLWAVPSGEADFIPCCPPLCPRGRPAPNPLASRATVLSPFPGPRRAAALGTGHKPVGCRGLQGVGLVTCEDSRASPARAMGRGPRDPPRPLGACRVPLRGGRFPPARPAGWGGARHRASETACGQ